MKIVDQKKRILKQQKLGQPTERRMFLPKPSLPTIILSGFLIASGCLFYLSQWSSYRRLTMEIKVLENKRNSLQVENEMLMIEINYLTRLDRLEALALGPLKMVLPEDSQHFLLQVPTSHE